MSKEQHFYALITVLIFKWIRNIFQNATLGNERCVLSSHWFHVLLFIQNHQTGGVLRFLLHIHLLQIL